MNWSSYKLESKQPYQINNLGKTHSWRDLCSLLLNVIIIELASFYNLGHLYETWIWLKCQNEISWHFKLAKKVSFAFINHIYCKKLGITIAFFKTSWPMTISIQIENCTFFILVKKWNRKCEKIIKRVFLISKNCLEVFCSHSCTFVTLNVLGQLYIG